MPSNPYGSKLADAKRRSRQLDQEYNRAIRNAARATSIYESEFLKSEKMRAMINGSHRLDEEALPSLRAECRKACIVSEDAWKDREANKVKAAALLEAVQLSKVEIDELQKEFDAWVTSNPEADTTWSFRQLFDALPIFRASSGSQAKASGESDPNTKTGSADSDPKEGDRFGEKQQAASSSDDDAEDECYPVQTQTPPQPVEKPEAAIAAFHYTAQQCFRDYTAITAFPEPPVTKLCIEDACLNTQDERALAACPCNVRATFEKKRDIKHTRLYWHPDKFARCREDQKQEFQAKASVVFVVLNEMYQESLNSQI